MYGPLTELNHTLLIDAAIAAYDVLVVGFNPDGSITVANNNLPSRAEKGEAKWLVEDVQVSVWVPGLGQKNGVYWTMFEPPEQQGGVGFGGGFAINSWFSQPIRHLSPPLATKRGLVFEVCLWDDLALVATNVLYTGIRYRRELK